MCADRAVLTESLSALNRWRTAGLLLAYRNFESDPPRCFPRRCLRPDKRNAIAPCFAFALLISVVPALFWSGAGVDRSARRSGGWAERLRAQHTGTDVALLQGNGGGADGALHCFAGDGRADHAKPAQSREGEDMGFKPEGRLLATINPRARDIRSNNSRRFTVLWRTGWVIFPEFAARAFRCTALKTGAVSMSV